MFIKKEDVNDWLAVKDIQPSKTWALTIAYTVSLTQALGRVSGVGETEVGESEVGESG